MNEEIRPGDVIWFPPGEKHWHGATATTAMTHIAIWVVRIGDDLYARSVNGHTSAWFRGVQVRHKGRIQAGGVDKDVTFVDAAPDINDQIDAAYRTKYRRYAASIISAIVSPEARAATIKLVLL